MTESSKDLLAITEHYLDLSRRLEKVYVYASMKNDQDTTVAKYQEYQAKATALYAKYSEVFAFYEPELMQLSAEDFAAFVAETPALSAYAHFFEQLFKRQAHVLSQKEEELLAGAHEIFGAAGETFEILDNADIVFPVVLDDEGNEVQLTHGNFISLLESKIATSEKQLMKRCMPLTNNSSILTLRHCRQMLRFIITMRVFTTSSQHVRQHFLLTSFQKQFMIH